MSFEAAQERLRNTGRNDPCPCESGKKYKKCHRLEDEKLARAEFERREAEATGGPGASGGSTGAAGSDPSRRSGDKQDANKGRSDGAKAKNMPRRTAV